MSKTVFMKALERKSPVPASGPVTSIVSVELMEELGAFFPEAHLDAGKMTLLAEAGHFIYGYDVVMPLFSICHESAALGCPVSWGEKDIMPRTTTPIWSSDADVAVPPDFTTHSFARVPLESISMLKERLGEAAAVCGKVFGPWTLGYHTFGLEEWLVSTITDPDMLKRAIDKLKEATVAYALAQIDSGADCIVIADHATRDLCSPENYRDFLMEVHSELAERIPCPCILHICGDTSDRIGMIAETGFECFHWDTKLGNPERARSLAGEKLALMGGINNPEVLRSGSIELIKEKCREAADAGIDIIAPECAVPLDTPMENLKAVGDFVLSLRDTAKSNSDVD